MNGLSLAPLLRHVTRRLAPLTLLISLPLLAELKPGFRDLKWGEGPTPDMMATGTHGERVLYQRKNEKLAIGDVTVSRILYAFYKSRLEGVSITAPAATLRDLLTIFTEQWGKPYQPNEFIESYSWEAFDSALGKTMALMEKGSDGVTVSIFSRKIYEERKADEKAAAKKAKDDL